MSNHYVLATDWETARKVAFHEKNGSLPIVYASSRTLVKAWQDQPLPMQRRYKPFVITIMSSGRAVVTPMNLEAERRLNEEV